MFNLGFTELILLGVIALIFIGPNQLPEVARTVGRLLNELKRATGDFQQTFTTNLTSEVQDRWNETRQQHAQNEALVSNHDLAVAAEQQESSESLPVGAHPVSEDSGGEGKA